MKETIKKLLRPIDYSRIPSVDHNRILVEGKINTQIQQKHLFFQYKQMINDGLDISFVDTGFKCFSQDDLDGKILFIFSMIGMKSNVGIDMASGIPECANLTNLICNWGWTGLLVEGDQNCVNRTKAFYQKHCPVFPPIVKCEWITAENINEIIQRSGISGEIDLFSLDVDGVDYWLWKSLEAVSPRVVIVEYQDIWGEESVTIPYDPKFDRFKTHEDYFGASLPAFVKLGKEKGYRLIGSNSFDYNAIFMKDGIGMDIFPEVSVSSCLQHPKVKQGQKTRLPKIKDLEWVRV